jgi:hypothetical protein
MNCLKKCWVYLKVLMHIEIDWNCLSLNSIRYKFLLSYMIMMGVDFEKVM